MTVSVNLFGSLYLIASLKVIEMDLSEGDTVGKVLERVVISHSGLTKRIFGEHGQLRVRLYLNESPCRADEEVKDGDEISIVSPIGGG